MDAVEAMAVDDEQMCYHQGSEKEVVRKRDTPKQTRMTASAFLPACGGRLRRPAVVGPRLAANEARATQITRRGRRGIHIRCHPRVGSDTLWRRAALGRGGDARDGEGRDGDARDGEGRDGEGRDGEGRDGDIGGGAGVAIGDVGAARGRMWLDREKLGPMAVIGNSMIELMRLGVLLPLRYVVVVPALWVALRLKDAVKPPAVLLRELMGQEGDIDVSMLVKILRAANKKGQAAVVVDFYEKECQGAPGAGRAHGGSAASGTGEGHEKGGRIPVNADVVKEYLVALVRTGRIDSYGGDAKVTPGDQNHASLSLLLRDLVDATDGKASRIDWRPGGTASWPLHIALDGGQVTGRGQASALQSIIWFVSTLGIIAIVWMIGAVTARRIVARSVQGQGMGQENPPGVASSLEPKQYAKENMPQKSVKTFDDVKGCDEAIAELKEIVEYLKKPEKFVKLGGTLPKGVLLTGPPGTGKTLLARAVAGEANVPFFYKSGSEFDEMFVGVGSRRVRSLFAAAKKKSPCIVFIDEIDAVGGTRSNYEASGGSRKTLNQLLTEMDGFEENSGVVVIGATNLAEMLDPALTRPGRFDRHVAVALPDMRGRKSVLDLYLSNKPVDVKVDRELLARRTPGFSGADLFNMVNEAALMAATKDLEQITLDCLDEARDKILMGSPRALSQSLEARRLTAYHEGGHALVALYTPGAKPIHKATIIPRGHALGMVSQVPDKDEYSTTKQQMMAHIDVCMGGKVAEEMVFGPEFVTSGATSDLKSATRMVRAGTRPIF